MVFCSDDNCHLYSDGETSSSPFSIDDVSTYNFQYHSYEVHQHLLPGTSINHSCRSQCITAHDNLVKVVKFIQNVLIDYSSDQRYVSSINCVDGNGQNGNTVWFGAGWYNYYHQAIFGQCLIENELRSLATALDIVAHEFFHGVTAKTADLKYAEESGALNESYSDIFAVLVANFRESDISRWQWEIGQGFGEDGGAIRSLSHPERYDQPGLFNNYDHDLRGYDYPSKYNDYGNVHTNSGIHNKAAFNLLTSRDGNGQYLFDGASGANLFYLALISLAETSLFIDSYRAIKKAGKSLFRYDSNRTEKLAAIDQAFNDVGISLS